MFVIVRRMIVAESKVDAATERFLQKDVVAEQDGFIDITVMQQTAARGEQELLVMVRWESEEHWRRWSRSEAHREMHRAQHQHPAPNYILHEDKSMYNVVAVKTPA